MKTYAIGFLAVFCASSSVLAQEPAPQTAPTEAPNIPPATAEPSAPAKGPEPAPAAPMTAEPGADVTPDAEPELSASELQQLGFGGDESTLDTSIHLSGFIDFSAGGYINEGGKKLERNISFYVGNINLYISKSITETLRTMAEVRFMYVPNGATGPDQKIVNTEVTDYADTNRTLRWGGIKIERVYLDWSLLTYLTLRVGQYLTPYGIWNVDHGTPTIITAGKPYVIGFNVFPQRQTGFELYGRYAASSDSTIGYHLTLSNGTGLVSEYKDLDTNKAIGARLYWELRGLGALRVGASGYYGRSTDAVSVSTLVPGGGLSIAQNVQRQYDTTAVAADAQWNYGGLHVQAEWIGAQQSFTARGRTPVFSIADGVPAYPPDSFSWGTYLLVGHRFDWFGVMPYVMGQTYHELLGRVWSNAAVFHLGVNIRSIDALALKLEYTYVHFTTPRVFPPDDLQVLIAQLAWAF